MNNFYKCILAAISLQSLSSICIGQAFKVSYQTATVVVNGDLKVNYGQQGQSVTTLDSRYDLLFSRPGQRSLEPVRTWQDELEEKMTASLDNFFRKLAQFDKNSYASATNVNTMMHDSAFASKYPKMMEVNKLSLQQYLTMEPVAEEMHQYFVSTPAIPVKFMNKIASGFLEKQRPGFEGGNAYYNQGQNIKTLAQKRMETIASAEKHFKQSRTLSKQQSADIKKAREKIDFAQNQIRKIMGNKTRLDQLTATARSEVLQIAGVVGMSLKQTAGILDTYLGVLHENVVFTGTLDVLKTFVETGIQEWVGNNKSLQQSFEKAFEMAYYKAVLHTSNSTEFPLSNLAVLPLKYKAIYDDAKQWEMLLEEPRKLRQTVSATMKEMDYAIKLNEQIIKRSNEQIDQILKSKTANYLKTPFPKK